MLDSHNKDNKRIDTTKNTPTKNTSSDSLKAEEKIHLRKG